MATLRNDQIELLWYEIVWFNEIPIVTDNIILATCAGHEAYRS